ncbi:MAG: glycosyltransferase family 4 protein [Candidatus Gastranaerophilaceae bacterium]
MRICIDLTSLADNFSGIERFALSITKELIKYKNHKWILLFKNSVHKNFLDEFDNVDKVVIKGKNKLIFNQVLLPLKLLKIKADVFLFLAFPAPFFFFKKESISAIHDLSCWDCPGSNKRYMIWYFKLMYWKASRCNKKILTVSEFSKKRIIKILKVNPQNITVVYNGLEKRFFSNVNNENNNEIRKKYSLPKQYLLCLSTLEPRKNLNILIKAYSKLIENNVIDIDLVLAGRKGWLIDDILNELSANVKNRIIFTGFVDEADLPFVYKNADFFVFPSKYEGFGIPPLESMACGTPVISSDATAMPEVLGDSVIYFKSNNVIDLTKKIEYAMKLSPENYINIAEKGKQVSQKYNWEKSAKVVLSAINCNKKGRK